MTSRRTAAIPASVAHARTAAAATARRTRGPRRRARRRRTPRPSGSGRTRGRRGRRWRRPRTAGRARGSRAAAPGRSCVRATIALALARDRDARHQPAAAASTGARRVGPVRADGPGRCGRRLSARSGRASPRRPPSAAPNGATSTPSSVTIAEMSDAGVTSKAGFQAVAPGGAIRTPPNSRTSVGRALLDRDRGAVGRLEVDRAERRADVERHAVAGGQGRQRVRPDLVGRVAVGRDPVGADEDRVDRARGEQGSGGRVGDERVGDAGLLELPGGQPGALEIRSRLVDVDVDLAAGVGRRLDDPERRPELAAGERSGVAVGEHPDGPIERARAAGRARARRASP